MKIRHDELVALLRLVNITNAEEIDCDEFLSRVSRYVEDMMNSPDAPQGHDQLLHHLKVCPECLEEFEAFCAAVRDGL